VAAGGGRWASSPEKEDELGIYNIKNQTRQQLQKMKNHWRGYLLEGYLRCSIAHIQASFQMNHLSLQSSLKNISKANVEQES